MASPRPAKRVLVVEDDHATREMYRLALSGAGYKVAAVEDGLDALRRIERERPDVVVLDLLLPRLGGEDVYQELRTNPATREVPVVIVTGSEVRHIETSRVRHFLRKPVTADTITRAVDQAASQAAGD